RLARALGHDARRRRAPLGCVVIGAEPAEGQEGEWWPEEVARRVGAAGRTSDVVGRLSRTEVAVVAPNTGPEGTLGLARRLVGAIGHARELGGARVRAGCFAVEDFAAASMEPLELLVRASTASHQQPSHRFEIPIRFFEEPVPAPS
ncbi:MAG TPA: hypothetical protein VFQ39_08340, partial [Longimicrobium sp.]|nr:hypothetical protein [Longimicrobium sp.]